MLRFEVRAQRVTLNQSCVRCVDKCVHTANLNVLSERTTSQLYFSHHLRGYIDTVYNKN